MRTANLRVERLGAQGAAFVIEEFARWVAGFPGVWGVTVRRSDLSGGSVDLHLVVHAELEPDGADAEEGRC